MKSPLNSIMNFLKRLKNRNGSSAVEFAVLLPILILLIFGIIEFGRAYNAYLSVSHAAREAARLAAVGKFDEATVESRAYPLTKSGGLAISGPYYPEGTDPGDSVEVTVSFPYEMNVPLWKKTSVNLKSKAIMRLE